MMMMMTGASIPPEVTMHLPPLFQIPPIFDEFSDFMENFKNFTFSRKISDFHPPKFLMIFFWSSTTNYFEFPLYFACFTTFTPPGSRKLLFPPPYFHKFLPCFRKIHQLFTCFVCISPLL